MLISTGVEEPVVMMENHQIDIVYPTEVLEMLASVEEHAMMSGIVLNTYFTSLLQTLLIFQCELKRNNQQKYVIKINTPNRPNRCLTGVIMHRMCNVMHERNESSYHTAKDNLTSGQLPDHIARCSDPRMYP